MRLYLDTHVVIWLYANEQELFSRHALTLIEKSDLRISPIVILELEYLHEIEKIRQPGSEIVDDLSKRIGLAVCDSPFGEVVETALNLSWTRDPFDRMLVAQAKLNRAPLLTRDATLQRHYAKAVW